VDNAGLRSHIGAKNRDRTAVALKFPSQVEAWDSYREAVTFVGIDAGTKADIACAVTAQALVQHFNAPLKNVPELIAIFRMNRELIEEIASTTYDLKGRRGPVVLKGNDFVGRLKPKVTH
jgi:hypothetical protein